MDVSIPSLMAVLGLNNYQELANLVGVSKASIDSWATGRKIPNSINRKKLADLYAQATTQPARFNPRAAQSIVPGSGQHTRAIP